MFRATCLFALLLSATGEPLLPGPLPAPVQPAVGGELRISHPFRRFEVVDGPAAWPIVEYERVTPGD